MASISKAIIGPVNSGTFSYSDSVSQPFRKQLSRSVWSGRCWSVDLTNFVPYTAVFRGPLGCNWTPWRSWGYSWLFLPPGTNSQEALPPPEEEQLPSFTEKSIESDKDHITCILPHCSKRFRTPLVPALCCCVKPSNSLGFYVNGLPRWCSGKGSASKCRRLRRREFNPCIRKFPWRRKWQPAPVLLPGESHGQRSLVGYSPWGHKESDKT